MAIKEDVYYEGGPHIGDLIFHCVLAITVVFIPITIGAIIRAIWVRYRITDRKSTRLNSSHPSRSRMPSSA